MECFVEIVTCFSPLNIFAKRSIIDVWQWLKKCQWLRVTMKPTWRTNASNSVHWRVEKLRLYLCIYLTLLFLSEKTLGCNALQEIIPDHKHAKIINQNIQPVKCLDYIERFLHDCYTGQKKNQCVSQVG